MTGLSFLFVASSSCLGQAQFIDGLEAKVKIKSQAGLPIISHSQLPTRPSAWSRKLGRQSRGAVSQELAMSWSVKRVRPKLKSLRPLRGPKTARPRARCDLFSRVKRRQEAEQLRSTLTKPKDCKFCMKKAPCLSTAILPQFMSQRLVDVFATLAVYDFTPPTPPPPRARH